MMQYDHGKRVTPQRHEVSTLEYAIVEYEQMAMNYHQKALPPQNETSDERARREGELADILSHLKSERQRIRQQVKVQAQLDQYIKEGKVTANENP